MKKSGIWLGMLVFVFVFGMFVIACDSNPDDEGTDPALLNGTWVSEDGITIIFDNGNYEILGESKGIYTTNGNKITVQATHWYGDSTDIHFDSKWYTKEEYRVALKASYVDLFGSYMSDAAIEQSVNSTIDSMFRADTTTYYISGNKLTITDDYGPSIFTKL